MIPRVIHQIWLGTNPIPEGWTDWAWSFRHVMPEWELILWAEHPENFQQADRPWTTVVQAPSLVMAHLAEKLARVHTPGHVRVAMSDVMRYEIVANHGGCYMDLDVELFEPLDDYLENVKLWGCDEHQRMVSNAIFGAEKNHPAMHRVVSGLEHHVHEKVQAEEIEKRTLEATKALPHGTLPRSLNPVATTGPLYLMAMLTKEADFVRFPWPRFHAVPGGIDASRIVGWPDTTIGHHHLGGSWYQRRKVAPRAELMEMSRAN